MEEQRKEGVEIETEGEKESHLVLYDGVVGQTQVCLWIVSELEGALVELRDRLVHV